MNYFLNFCLVSKHSTCVNTLCTELNIESYVTNLKQYADISVGLSTTVPTPLPTSNVQPPQASHRLETNVSQAPLPSKSHFRVNNDRLWVIFGKKKKMKSHFCPDNSWLTESLWQMTSCSITRKFTIHFSELSSSVLQVAEIIGEGTLWLSYCLKFWTLEMFSKACFFNHTTSFISFYSPVLNSP